jgi:hypothetical protein
MKSPQSVPAALSPSSSERRHALVAWVILALGLVASIALTIGVRYQVQQEANHQFEAASRDVLYRVQSEIGSYEEVLVGLSAFLRSKKHVSRAEFRRYVEGLDLNKRFPGFDASTMQRSYGGMSCSDLRRASAGTPPLCPRDSLTFQSRRPVYVMNIM